VLRLMQALLDAGADRDSLADTVGYADPRMVRELFGRALAIPGDRLMRIQMLLSDPTVDPLDRLDRKSALGAYDRGSKEARS
jgi:hypothetical protein